MCKGEVRCWRGAMLEGRESVGGEGCWRGAVLEGKGVGGERCWRGGVLEGWGRRGVRGPRRKKRGRE
jgi:hypothetical protein